MALTFRWAHYNATEAIDIERDITLADIIKEKGRKPLYRVFSNRLEGCEEPRQFNTEEAARTWVEEAYVKWLSSAV
ncbi:MAG: hypothetical protein Q4A61_03425 [Porphyromonadaceae bacterium]|nr:hypothetical protein [Porphyromonadaceae bacterium]